MSHRLFVLLLLSCSDPLQCQQVTDKQKVSDSCVIQSEVVTLVSGLFMYCSKPEKHWELPASRAAVLLGITSSKGVKLWPARDASCWPAAVM